MLIPDNIAPIFDRPGQDWNQGERPLVISWLTEGDHIEWDDEERAAIIRAIKKCVASIPVHLRPLFDGSAQFRSSEELNKAIRWLIMDRIFDEPGRMWDKPGQQWALAYAELSTGEADVYNLVAEWLFEGDQFQYLLAYTQRRLGYWASEDDAGQVLADFWPQLENVKQSYDPVVRGKENGDSDEGLPGTQWTELKPAESAEENGDPDKPVKKRRFWNYLLSCLQFFCWEQGRRIRRKRGIEVSADALVETETGDLIVVEIEDTASENDPLLVTQWKQFLELLNEWIPTVRNENHWKVLILCDFLEYSYEEAAYSLGCPIGSVRGWLHRARKDYAKYLRMKGWEL